MKINHQVIKQCEITLRHLAKDIRSGEVDSTKVAAISKLLDQYGNLIRLSREDKEESGFYEEMEQEALKDVSLKR